ncbi:MAG: hypothetical protein ACK6AT_09525 [Planctomycetota bacterium]
MDAFVILACSGCTFSNPVFTVLSIFFGTVPVAYLLLRPYTKAVRTWGLPRINVARLFSLVLLFLCLVPLWFIGRQERSAMHVGICIAGLGGCCVYLWLRFCWLLDMHHFKSTRRELLLPGIIAPAVLMLGTTVGSGVLGILLEVPVSPMIIVPHTIWSVAIGILVGSIAFVGLNYTFGHPRSIATVNEGLPHCIVAEQSGEREPPMTPDLKS